MALFSLCVLKIIPLYIYILLGYLAGRFLNAHRETIAKIMLFMINPIVIFSGVIHTRLDMGVLFLPFFVFVISTLMCFCFFLVAKNIWQDSTRSVVAYSAGSGNTGYFGLPIALLLFNEQGEGVYIMAILGVTFFENSVGYYVFARETMSARECFKMLFKLPALYAFIIGLSMNAAHLPIPLLFDEFIGHIKGTYTVLGMMMIGLGLSTLTHFKLDFKFLGLTFLAKFVIWPVIILALIQVDIHLFKFFDQQIYNVLILLAIVPLGSSVVMMASLMKSHPEKAALSVILSILLALIYVPVMIRYLIC